MIENGNCLKMKNINPNTNSTKKAYQTNKIIIVLLATDLFLFINV